MLLVVEGYFEAGRFIADTPVQIPEGKKTIVTVLDEEVNKDKERENYVAYWNKESPEQSSGVLKISP
ncbi:MAG: hypothetical protein LBK05_10090 [Treponema sp.]|nr:hypothetical protein [Treponema sp.]